MKAKKAAMAVKMESEGRLYASEEDDEEFKRGHLGPN